MPYPMTVNDLIEELQKMGGHLPVRQVIPSPPGMGSDLLARVERVVTALDEDGTQVAALVPEAAF